MAEVFTNVDFIAEGLQYPPLHSTSRLSAYELNKKRYAGKYNENKFIVVRSKVTGENIKYPVVTENFFKLTTEKMCSLLLSQLPLVTCGDEETTSVLQGIIKDSGFWLQLQNVYRSFSSLGDGVLYLYVDDEGEIKTNVVSPSCWYSVVNPFNIDEVTCHVLVNEIFENDYKTTTPSRRTHLRVLYHYKGYYIEKIYNADDYKVKDLVSEKKYNTGLSDFAVFTCHNAKSLGELYGQSDYESIADAVRLYESAYSLIHAVLEHSGSPLLQVPKGVGKQNSKTGRVEFSQFGGFVEVPADAKDIKYVGLDAPLTETLAFIDNLLSEIGIQSELSKAFLCGDFGNTNASAEALKTLLKSALDKSSRIVDSLDTMVKRVFVQMLFLKGISIKPSEINIEWQDGLVDSESVIATTQKTLREAGVLSRKRALMKYSGMTAEQADSELLQIENEEKEV